MKKIHENIRRNILRLIDFFYPFFKKWFSLQTFRYAACGGANTVLDISIFSVGYNFIFQKHMLALGFVTLSPHIAALFLDLSITVPTGFYLNRYVVFQHAGLKGHIQLFRYIFVVIICIVLNYVFLKFFVDYMGWYPTISKIVTTAFVVIFSYISQTFYFFKPKILPKAHPKKRA
jgi:putative flippase GtrA